MLLKSYLCLLEKAASVTERDEEEKNAVVINFTGIINLQQNDLILLASISPRQNNILALSPCLCSFVCTSDYIFVMKVIICFVM